MAQPFATPCDVTVHSLNARPDLNGRRGRADSFSAASGRYNVTLQSGETVALRAANLEPLQQRPAHQAGGGMPAAAAGGGFGAGLGDAFGMLEPRFIAFVVFCILTFLMEVSLVVAGLAGGLTYLLMNGARQHGGLGPAVGSLTRSLADGFNRVTGARITPAQAVFLAVVCSVLLWRALGGNLSYNSGYGSRGRRTSSRGYGSDYGYGYGGGGGGMLGLGNGVDFSFMIGAAMLGNMVWRLGGGGRPGGWTVGNFVRNFQNLDFFQMMMFINLVQQVLGGGRRRGYGGYGGYGGFGRRMYY